MVLPQSSLPKSLRLAGIYLLAQDLTPFEEGS